MLQHSALQLRRATLWTIAGTFALLSVIPALLPSMVSAAPALTERELQTTTARPAISADLTWRFDTTADAANVEYIEIEFCNLPLTACGVGDVNGADNTTIAADNIPIVPGSPTATIGGPGGWNAPANSATRTNGDSGGTSNQLNIDVTTGFAGASADEATIAVTGFTNDEETNASYYTRMRVYSDAGTTLVWEGVFAQSTSQTLTVNARVQERLDFCVGSTTVDDSTTSVGAACANITGSNVDIGNVESGTNNVSPVNTVNGGDDENGVAMVRTNAVNGIVVDYKSVLNSSSGALKVAGATCNAVPSTVGTDQCFNTSSSQSTLVAGTEEFGMTIAGVNCGSVTAYTCDFLTAGGGGVAGTDYNLQRDTEFDGEGAGVYAAENDQVAGTTTSGFAWDATGTLDRIASSSGSTVKVVDDEALILKFAATAGITTPTGSYTVQSDFIATATF